MMHLPLLPMLLPLLAAVVMLALHRQGVRVARGIALVSVLAQLVLAVLLLLRTADGTVLVLALGNWPLPFGIGFVADRLAATMLAVTVAVALPALLAAMARADRAGRHFHVFFQFLLAGINGAFLTGDLFNLFVCFEVLLIASYALLAHGGGAARSRAALHYVVLNLTGSVVFLFALGLLYGTLGTLNLADVARRLAAVPVADAPLVRAALLLLCLVFVFKAAVLPLGFWLPRSYPAAEPCIAAIFAVLGKVGIYALLRLSTTTAGAAPWVADLLAPWLWPAALATILLAMLGVLAADRFGGAVAWLMVMSTGMLAAAVAQGGTAMTAALLYYLPHTTLVTAGLFLLAGRIAEWRGEAGDMLLRGPPLAGAGGLMLAYLLLAVAVTGLPPLSGFLGKVMLLTAAPGGWPGYALWACLILSGFVAALALARAASTLFWEQTDAEALAAPALPVVQRAALLLALAYLPLLVLAAAPISGHAQGTAAQLMQPAAYLRASLPR